MRFLLLLLFSCNICFAQRGVYSFFGDSSVVKDIPLGEPSATKLAYPEFSGRYIYLIESHDLYALFGYDTMMLYRDFNFSAYHIIGEKACRKCKLCRLAYCHAALCNEEWIWTMRRNDLAFTTIPKKETAVFDRKDIPELYPRWGDTVVQPSSIADSGFVRWYTTGRGDCRSSFSYELWKDNFYPVVLMKEFVHDGGCRAAGSRSVMLRFSVMPGVLYYQKNRILKGR